MIVCFRHSESVCIFGVLAFSNLQKNRYFHINQLVNFHRINVNLQEYV